MRLHIWKCQLLGGIIALAMTLGLAGGSLLAEDAARVRLLDDTLDLYVRDGLVYYRALKSDRSRLDRFVSWLATEAVGSGSRDEQIAFWINAYNALVLKTVIDHYPIVQHSKDYPARSIRQIPGAFERLTHRVGAGSVTLDQIEQMILGEFRDPGSIWHSGAERSEAEGCAAKRLRRPRLSASSMEWLANVSPGGSVSRSTV